MSKKYNYFCDCCGRHFESDLPEKDEHGLSNEISCPHCGAWDIYPDTEEARMESVRRFSDYEVSQEMEDDE